MRELTVAKNPCATCPYRKDVPSGVWSHEDYEKLRKYDAEPMPSGENLGVFLCHNTTVADKGNIACKGWLVVHADSVAVRLAMVRKLVSVDDLEPPPMKLHKSGNAAADFGQRGIRKPNKKARALIEKLNKTGKFTE